jgi:hypothetical protein
MTVRQEDRETAQRLVAPVKRSAYCWDTTDMALQPPPRATASVKGSIMTDHYDVIVIGSGAGGGTLTHALAPAGKRILLLEADFTKAGLPSASPTTSPGGSAPPASTGSGRNQ